MVNIEKDILVKQSKICVFSITVNKHNNITNQVIDTYIYAYKVMSIHFIFCCRWWGQSQCPDYSKPSADETSELALENVAGIFFVLIGGVAGSFIAFVVDRLLQKAKRFNDKVNQN